MAGKRTTKHIEATVMVKDVSGKEIEPLELPQDIFGITASDKLLAQYVRVYLANQRQGTAHTKTRAEVNATTKKVYKQKGTGRARHGARSASLFVGGGVTHGPKPRSFSLKLNKKQRAKALYCSLSLKAHDSMIQVLGGLEGLDGKTKAAGNALKNLGLNTGKTLIVYAPGEGAHLRKQFSNIKTLSSSQDRLLNAYKVLRADTVVFTRSGFQDFLTFRRGKTE
ncbi:50S ribosomal protein L4 [Candidatus Roizmanbacteria bacterium RIFCSPLOWO2_01_FULL_42_14]|uniref:Large ribosomal subunit protein uL4 n=4 Tax=Candidatus Roizmaniibacteriota TaxID=1752723 RepID=A0A1F7JV15_9BACT|nr:MAG: 50S ribosomal protein L4 [Candidatus Roizmanbacteria bacterium RIFCSPHIGHO2_02_FULL_43_11]OGK38596.1 MAG: 50S ribosomal protein L4 [Candidatus Roizmanbacteria bacterium RIFCSPHIGHO2_12_FULL_42_10]OGK52224.1 MAG: 50S ribosomal protein L4 [Candidatus Roizmanbacteria bacterium RIFCSPLOWO2_01_FULL_42_14]OGK59455.1 MAG: 50S ribosomal protein L4 [Candidatus Roizmanbacteria bacterium RIFCSPLOWO2_02_FULL_43_10]